MSFVTSIVYGVVALYIKLNNKSLKEQTKYRVLLLTLLLLILPLHLVFPQIDIINNNNIDNLTMNPDVALTSTEESVTETKTSVDFQNQYLNNTSPFNEVSTQNASLYIYVFGAVILLGSYFISILRFNTRIRKFLKRNEIKSIADKPEIYVIDEKMSPFVFGLINPKIIVPKYLKEEENFQLILEHEQTHIKRHDVLIKHLANLLTIIHWFNPAIYLLKRDLFNTMESSCDEAVLENCSTLERKGYASLVLDTLETNIMNSRKYSLGFASSNKEKTKERIYLIMNDSKKSKFKKISTYFTIGFALIITLFISRNLVFANTLNTPEPVEDITDVMGDENDSSDTNNISNETDELDETLETTETEEIVETEEKNEETVVPEEKTVVEEKLQQVEKKEIIQKVEEPKKEINDPNRWATNPVRGSIILCEWGCFSGHLGTDFSMDPQVEGVNIYPIANGTVVDSGFDRGGWGYYIVVQHSNGFKSLYSQMQSVDLEIGTQVTTKTVIGKIGMSGRTTTPHVHVELYNPEKEKVDLGKYLK